jgi:hypothetical protein
MNLASRCREAITQASNMKKDLSIQKKKTAEAVAQTHLLLDQLKKMKHAHQLELQLQHQSSTGNEKQPQVNGKITTSATNVPSISMTPTMLSVVSSENDDITNTPSKENRAVNSTNNLNDMVNFDTNDMTKSEDPMLQEGKDTPVSTPTTMQSTPTNTSSNKSTLCPKTTTALTETSSSSILNKPISSVPAIPVENDIEPINTTANDIVTTNAIATSTNSITDSKTMVQDVVTSSSSNNIVDLDISHDFDLDDKEQQHNIINSLLTINNDQKQTFVDEPSPLSNGTINSCRSNDDFDVIIHHHHTVESKSNDESKEQKRQSSSESLIVPSHTDGSLLLHQNTDIDETKESSQQSPVLGEETKETKVKTVLSIITMDSYDYDDSEHKSDDIIFSLESSPPLHPPPPPPPPPTAFTNNIEKLSPINDLTMNDDLISSDDYEGINGVDDNVLMNDAECIDNLINETDDTKDTTGNVASIDNAAKSTSIVKPIESMTIPVVVTGFDEKLLVSSPIKDESDLAKISTTTINKTTTDKESKDSWLEDYDEALMGDETYDTLSSLNSPTKKEYFPHSASPKISGPLEQQQHLSNHIKKRIILPPSLNDSYEEEFPSDIIDQRQFSSYRKGNMMNKLISHYKVDSKDVGDQEEKEIDAETETNNKTTLLGPLQERGQSSNLLCSIDAFEVSFQTDFPESFTPKDGTTPSSSPTPGAKPIIDANTTLNDPYVTNPSSLSKTNSVANGEANERVDVSAPGSMKTWGGGLRERATAAFQRNSGRRSANSNNDVPNIGDTTSFQPKTLTVMTATVSPVQPTKLKTIANYDSDQSKRWLMEVKASTEKKKYVTEPVEVNEVTSRLESTRLDIPVNICKPETVTSSAKTGHFVKEKSLLVPSPPESSRIKQNNEPVFRQFPRSSTPIKPIKHITSHSNRISILDDDHSIPISDKAPLLQGKISDEYDSPQSSPTHQQAQRTNGAGITMARSRYVNSLIQTSGAKPATSERGRSSISRQIQPNEKQVNSKSERLSTSLHVNSSDINGEAVSSHGMNNTTVNVRERAAMYSKISSPDVKSPTNGKDSTISAFSQSNFNNNENNIRSNWRGSSRSTVQLLDEGDIPMQTSLSPRKSRNGEHKCASSSERNSVNSVMIDDALGNYHSGRGKAAALEQDRRHIDVVGKQRRHINLSGSGRLLRQFDRENDVSPIYDGKGNREI